MKEILEINVSDDISELKKYKNITDKYNLHISGKVERLYGGTVFAGPTIFDSYEFIEIFYDGTTEMWRAMKKGTAKYSKVYDDYGDYYHHQPDEYVYRRSYDPWIRGYDNITVHCSDGDIDYNEYSDEYNEAETIDE